MTAGVQSFEPGAAYLPSPPSNAGSQSKADAKGPDPGGEASDFQREMDLQHASPEPKSNGRPEKGSAKNAGKKQNLRADRASDNTKAKGKDDAATVPVAVTPAQVVEPQRQILPITFASPPLDETTDDAAQADASQGEATQEAVSQDTALSNISNKVSNDIVLQPAVSQNVMPAKEPSEASLAPAAQNELIPAKTEQNDGVDKNPTVAPQKPVAIFKSVATDGAREVAPPESKDPQSTPQPAAGPLTTVVTNPIITAPIAINQPATGQPAAPSQPPTYQIQPVSQPELQAPELKPLEPAPAAAPQKVEDAPTPTGPSALAFAVRLTAVQQPQQSDPTTLKNPAPPVSGSDAAVATRIPVRYAATAQIISQITRQITPQITPRPEQKSEGDLESQVDTKYVGPALDSSARPDFVVPGPPATNDTAKSSQSQPTPDPLPNSRTERIIEPPAAPPTSSRDIRVQVPDNNGGLTQVRFLETGGEVRVSVRTADTGLAQSLRSHLNDLSLKLAEGGVPAELWKPASSGAASQNEQHQPDREGRGSEGRHSGSHSGGQSGSQRDQQDQQDRPAWLEEMEASLLARK